MTKDEIIEAINSTIVANGQKGITAESLNLILTEIVNAAGEGGSGDGALRVIIPDNTLDLWSDFEFSPAGLTEAITAVSESVPDFANSDYVKVIEAAFAHNAEVYQQIVNLAQEQKSAPVILDGTATETAAMRLMASIDPEGGAFYEGANLGVSGPAMCVYLNIPNAGETMLQIMSADESMFIGMTPDGGFETFAANCVLYIPDEGITLTEEQLANNASVAQYISMGASIKVITSYYLVRSETDIDIINDYIISKNSHSSLLMLRNNILKEVDFASDGSVTVTTLGSLNTPTA